MFGLQYSGARDEGAIRPGPLRRDRRDWVVGWLDERTAAMTMWEGRER